MPSVATVTNLCCGVVACAFAVEGLAELGALMIVLAVLFDSVDGALARKLDVASDFGMELDSLADVISFGIAPAMLVGTLISAEFELFGWGLALLFPVCSAWRLARFNVESRSDLDSHADFSGLPTTGAGGAVAAVVLVHAGLAEHGMGVFINLLPCLMVLLAVLMLSRLPYRHIGPILSRMPLPMAMLWSAMLILGAIVWRYELVLAGVFWAYVLSGPAEAVKEKIMASHHARP